MSLKYLVLTPLLVGFSLHSGCESEGEENPSPSPEVTPTPSVLATPTPVESPTAAPQVNIECPDNSDWTVGLVLCDPATPAGYVLFSPLNSGVTYLVDTEGELIHTWTSSYRPGQAVYLLENGDLLRTINPGGNSVFKGGGAGGGIQRQAWDGTLLWDWRYSSNTTLSHHDIQLLPSGNVLVIAWEYKSYNEAIAAGRNPALVSSEGLWSEKVIEVEPTGATTGKIVWEWKAWDHLIQDFDASKPNFGVIADHPERLDVNTTGTASGVTSTDWLHFNAIDYHEELDQIVVSSRVLSEFLIIDHSTTTAQAASSTGGESGQGGDFLYRWGNPQNYDSGTTADRKLYGQHSVHFIPEGLPGAGNILVFNNGEDQSGRAWSSVDELEPPLRDDGSYAAPSSPAFGPTSAVKSWTASPATSFYATRVSGAQRLVGGQTLVTDGVYGDLFMFDAAGKVIWDYVIPLSASGAVEQGSSVPTSTGGSESGVFRAYYYAPDYAAFAGRTLVQQGTIEQ